MEYMKFCFQASLDYTMHSYTVKWEENPITSTIFSEQEILACLVPKMREEEPKTENPLRGPNQYSEFGFEYKQDAISGDCNAQWRNPCMS